MDNNERILKNIYTCFPGWKHKCLTMSYDDGRIFDKRLVEIFNKNGIKGTFHLNSGLFNRRDGRVQFDEIKEVYKGHEVSCHTYTHPTTARCPISEVIKQITEDRKILEEAAGYPVRGMSYPNGSYSREIIDILPALGIEYSRVVETTGHFGLPEDLYRWKATCHHAKRTDNGKNLKELGEEFIGLHKTQYLYLMYVWGHSYEFDTADNWDIMEDFCAMIGNRDDIWYTTNIGYVDYMNAAKNLRYTMKGDMVYNPSAMSVFIRVDEKPFEIKGGETVVLC
ncbi:MAG: polysaccharide deacetylase family protein [Oscillospiraceae bacterium]|nr:polysaccharide deacetylase family protein [Oscillospiraceae bacterium]